MNRTASNITLVCYDITSDKLRRKIDKCMKDFGVRLQCSVFMCRLDADGVARCREKLQKVLKTYLGEREPDDSLIIFERFHPNIADSLLGMRIEPEPAAFGII
jgi:CRISPR-associated endonuclease Cas2